MSQNQLNNCLSTEQQLFLYKFNFPESEYICVLNNDNEIMYKGSLISTHSPTIYYTCICEITNPNNIPLNASIQYYAYVNYKGPC